MSGPTIGIAIASLAISLSFGALWVIAFPVVLVSGLLFGIPLLRIFNRFGWLSWWHAAAAGSVATLPFLLLYLSTNQGHTEHVGLYNSVFTIGMGLLGGLIVWLLGIFRNPDFSKIDQPFPKSVFLTVPIFAALFLYHQALEPVHEHGCIVEYRVAENPTAWKHSRIAVETSDGKIVYGDLTIGYSNPRIVGNCAGYSKKPTAMLKSYSYSVHSTDSNGCHRACPNQSASIKDHSP